MTLRLSNPAGINLLFDALNVRWTAGDAANEARAAMLNEDAMPERGSHELPGQWAARALALYGHTGLKVLTESAGGWEMDAGEDAAEVEE